MAQQRVSLGPPRIPVAASDGARLRALREQCGLRMERVARHLSVPMSTVYDWESGFTAIPWEKRRELLPYYEAVLAAIRESGGLRKDAR